MTPDIQAITSALRVSWDADTAYDSNDWSLGNPARGQCVVSSLVVQDYLGGDLLRYSVDEGDFHETHYVNVLDDGTVIDTTASQYVNPVTMRRKPIELKGFASVREKRLADESTRRRYEILKRRVKRTLTEGLL